MILAHLPLKQCYWVSLLTVGFKMLWLKKFQISVWSQASSKSSRANFFRFQNPLRFQAPPSRPMMALLASVSPATAPPLESCFLFLKGSTCLQLSSFNSPFPDCRILEVQQSSFIFSCLCSFLSKLSVTLNYIFKCYFFFPNKVMSTALMTGMWTCVWGTTI